MPDKAVDLVKALSITEVEVLGRNPSRIYALLVNPSAEEVFLAMGIPAVVDRGIPLLSAGSNYEINLTNPWHGSIHAVSKAGTPNLLITEW
ncbi:unnamed protein product [marine sediment metagenome]|uniref:Uncharacterized protein n=1 Tax=marine sediment metagenome TaxID=412755 RepID=X1KEK2_9ZZZZ